MKKFSLLTSPALFALLALLALSSSAVAQQSGSPWGPETPNFNLEVVLSGSVDPTTGMVCNLVEIDEFAHRRLIAKFDHQNLNTLPEFAGLVPSTENLAIVIWEILKSFTAAKVEKIRIEETPNNSFEYRGE